MTTSEPAVVLVGNGFSVRLNRLGRVIDAAQTVVRFNCFQTTGWEECVGRRTDVWICNLSSKDTEAELRRRANDRSEVGSLLFVAPDGRSSSRKRLRELVQLSRTLYPTTPAASVAPAAAERLKQAIGSRPTTGLIAVDHFLRRHDRVHICGFDILRGAACPPRHYWGGRRSNIRKVHAPEREGAWLRRRIDEGIVVNLVSDQSGLTLTAEQNREWRKYNEIFGRTVTGEERGYGASNHARRAYGLFRSLRPASVVDVGCGNGEFCRWLRGELETPKVLAVDWASLPDLPPSVLFFRAPAWSLPFDSKSVSYLTAFDLLEHLLPRDVGPTLREFVRVARDGMMFSVSFRDSRVRAANGSTLHPTVRPKEWWAKRIREETAAEVKTTSQDDSGLFHLVLKA